MTDHPTNDSAAELDRLRFALQSAQIGTWILDIVHQQVWWDAQCKQLYGFGQDDIVPYHQVLSYVHEDDRQRVDQAVQWALDPQSGGHYDVQFRTVRPQDSQLRWLHCRGRADFNETGVAYRFAGTAQDTTTQHELSVVLGQTKELEVANLTLQTNQDWLTSVFVQAPVAIALLTGPDYRIKLANASMYEVWQLPADHVSVINQPVFEAFPGIRGLGLEDALDQVRQSGLPIRLTEIPATFLREKGPELAYINSVYAPILNQDGMSDIVVIVTEVTQQVVARQRIQDSEESYRWLSEELAVSNQGLAESNRLLIRSNDNLQTFAYVASHDLQEPLRKIQQFGDLLNTRFMDAVGEEGAVYIERMQSAASRMSQLIKDLLEYSRISTQREVRGSVSLEEVIRQVQSTLELSIQVNQAQLKIEPLPTVRGDASQLNQLFQNLLSNALKFHRPGVAPRITINAHRLAAEHLPPGVQPSQVALAYHRIDVADNGIGFEEKYVERIFQVFQRLHGKREFAGTGIGLAICEKVVANHGGAITASSQPGHGATFSIYLPV